MLSPGTAGKLLRTSEYKSSEQSPQEKIKRMVCCLQKKLINVFYAEEIPSKHPLPPAGHRDEL